ncbi:MAG TPA: trypsin-like peptidase domain-containing protein [Gaiellaceae bacterium]
MKHRQIAAAATVALVAGVGVGAGSYAAFGGGTTKTQTVVREQPAPAPTPAAARTTESVGSVYKAARDGVVEITVSSNGASGSSPFPFGGRGSQQAQGSGFVSDTAGHVITNYHVVQGASSISVAFADGSKYPATVVGSDQSTDLAVLKVDAPAGKLHPLSLGDSAALQVGDGVVAIGSPFGLPETVTSGIVSALNRDINATNGFTISGAIQTDAAINHGNSGGPLLDMSGHVVGITTQIESESGGNEGVGFAVPSNTIRSVAAQLVNGQKVQHAYLGVFVAPTTTGSGARLAQVKSGSPAASAGLKAGDVITSFGGQSIRSPDDLTSAVANKKPGDKVSLTYLRGNHQTKTTEVTLGTRPA